MCGIDMCIDDGDNNAIHDVIFDFCGVLVDWQPKLALQGLFPQSAIDEFFADDDRCGFLYFDDLHDGGVDYDDLIVEYEREYGARLGLMMRAYADHVDRSLVGMIPGMMPLLDELTARGIGVWGLTNWGRDTWPVMQRRFPELIDRLNGVTVSGFEGVKKPETAIFDRAVKRFGIDRRHTVFVDDSPYNVAGAQESGLRSIRFLASEQLRDRLIPRDATA